MGMAERKSGSEGMVGSWWESFKKFVKEHPAFSAVTGVALLGLALL